MNRIKPGRPTPAFVIAVVALFVSLGGTGYAAKQITAGGSKKKAATVTKAQVNKMIATYFAAHRAELKGEAGPVGAAGKNGAAGEKKSCCHTAQLSPNGLPAQPARPSGHGVSR